MLFVIHYEIESNVDLAEFARDSVAIAKEEKVICWYMTPGCWGVFIVDFDDEEEAIDMIYRLKKVLPGAFKTITCSLAIRADKLAELAEKLQ